MKTNIIINRLKDLRDKGECVSETIVLEQAIKSLEALEEVKQDLYKFAKDSFDAECAECYRIALRCVEGHLKEAGNDS